LQPEYTILTNQNIKTLKHTPCFASSGDLSINQIKFHLIYNYYQLLVANIKWITKTLTSILRIKRAILI